MAQSIRGFIDEDEGWVDRFVGSWRDLAGGRGRSISSWVHGAISPSRGGDEDGNLTGAISNSTARSLSLCLRVCESFLSLRVFENDLKVKLKLKIFFGSRGLFYSQSKWFFGKLYFPCATKHTVSCKRISWNRFQPKQIQPKSHLFSTSPPSLFSWFF